MLVVLGFCHKDISLARELLAWIRDLDGTIDRHELLLIGSSMIERTDLIDVHQLACKSFSKVTAIKQQNADERGWPMSANSMFQLGVQWVKDNHPTPFLWLEPDCVPLSKGWLDILEGEYKSKNVAFMGTVFERPYKHLNGVMIYPDNIARYNRYMLNGTSIPWDLTRAEITLRAGHNTHLIQRLLSDPQTNTPMTFPGDNALAQIRPNAVLFHGCKDGTLVARLREREGGVAAQERPSAVITKKIARKVSQLIRGGSSYYHSGNLGDIIYSLYAIKLHGGGDLMIGPEQAGTSPCTTPVTLEQFNLLQPLLKHQSYLKRVSWRPKHPREEVAYDLNRFRDDWNNHKLRQANPTLCKMTCHTLGVDHLFDQDKPWLEPDRKVWTEKIIIHRSRRYQSKDFPWKELVDKYSDRMLFVGHEDEWRKFQQDFNCRVSFYVIRDFLELARVISGGECFIGNQSFPLSLAIAMGQRIYCEAYPNSPDCFFERPTFVDQRSVKFTEFEKWLHGITEFKPEKPVEPAKKKLVTIRRSSSIGDVLSATCVASALVDQGHEIEWEAHAAMHPILRRHPKIKCFAEPTEGDVDVNLDGAYETHPERTSKHFAELFIEKANEDLKQYGINIPKVINFAPRIYSDDTIRRRAELVMHNFPKPWTVVCPRSWSWVNRTVPDSIWATALPMINGTKFWLGNTPAPAGVVDLKCTEIEMLIEYIACADMLVSVDSGPLHLAAALGTPAVAINQASSPALHLSNQRDWIQIEPDLPCLNCQKNVCPFDANKPPCQNVDPVMIADAANKRLRSITSEDVSAVIAVYKPKPETLKRCLDSVLPQVNEVIIVGDQSTPNIFDKPLDPKIKFIRINAYNTGYGRKATRGAREINGKYIWFVNDDCFPRPDVGEKLLSLIKGEVAIASHLLLYEDGTVQYGGVHRRPGAIGFGHIDHRAPKCRYYAPVEEESVCGASVMVRRDVFFDVDGFSEEYFLYSEDSDFAMKVRQKGWKIMFHPKAIGTHLEHQSTGITGNVNELCRVSGEIFCKKWGFYFEKNKNVNVLGKFE